MKIMKNKITMSSPLITEEDKKAVLKAVEAVDRELGNIIEDCRTHGVTLIVTSDHGTVEEWLYPDGMINTGHTKNPVPFILADFYPEDPEWLSLREEGELADVAPTASGEATAGEPDFISSTDTLEMRTFIGSDDVDVRRAIYPRVTGDDVSTIRGLPCFLAVFQGVGAKGPGPQRVAQAVSLDEIDVGDSWPE